MASGLAKAFLLQREAKLIELMWLSGETSLQIQPSNNVRGAGTEAVRLRR